MPDLLHAAGIVAAAFALSLVASVGGLSGAFLLLPFQVSVLGVVGPQATATNHLFNVLAIPFGASRLRRERRLVGPLVAAVLAGSLPGVALGAVARVRWLSDPEVFRGFAAVVLLLAGGVLLARLPGRVRGAARPGAEGLGVRLLGRATLEVRWEGRTTLVPLPAVAAVAFLTGAAGAAYGIGGGALLAPILFTAFRLPPQATAGATLLGTLASSALALAAFLAIGALGGSSAAGPDWGLGLLLGLGGTAGIALGTRLQMRLPAAWIEGLVGLMAAGMGLTWAARALLP